MGVLPWLVACGSGDVQATGETSEQGHPYGGSGMPTQGGTGGTGGHGGSGQAGSGQGGSGQGGSGQAGSGTTVPATLVSSSRATTCAVRSDHRIKCWGDDPYGQLGQGDTERRGDEPGEMGDHLPAIDLGTGARIAAMGVSPIRVCAALTSGVARCWGARLDVQGPYDAKAQAWGDDPGEMGDALPPVDLGA